MPDVAEFEADVLGYSVVPENLNGLSDPPGEPILDGGNELCVVRVVPCTLCSWILVGRFLPVSPM